MYWYLRCWKLAFFLNGRARRKEFGIFTLIHTFIFLIIKRQQYLYMFTETSLLYTLIAWIYFFICIAPFISVGTRRMHDIGRSGWWILLVFVPIIGLICLLVLFFRDSEPGENQWGENPKGIEAEEAA